MYTQGMLDMALLASNASQLKYLMQVRYTFNFIEVVFHLSQFKYISDCLFHLFVKVGEVHQYYTEMVALVVTSIVLQVSSKYCSANYLLR